MMIGVNMSFSGLCLTLVILLMCIVTTASSYRYNASCTAHIDCLPRETFMRCVKGHCTCAADSTFDFDDGYCRLKINVRCYLSGKILQRCVARAYCDPPRFTDGKIIQSASTGNCVCYQGESNVEDGTCSAAASLRSFGHSSLIFDSSLNNTIVMWAVSISATIFNLCRWWHE